METLYDNPRYYEIAFSFRDIPGEVDVFQQCVERFSDVSISQFLELGCGHCPHMPELIKRGYRYTGIDLSEAMLAYARQRASGLGPSVKLLQADMVHFSLDTPVDFAYILLGSLYVTNTAELVSHFDSVARALNTGGLYLLDWCVHFEPPTVSQDIWELRQDGIHVKVTYSARPVNHVEQTFEETSTVDVEDHGLSKRLVQRCVRRAIFPQEFLAFMAGREDFEFVGWWNRWDLSQPIDGSEKHITRPIVVVRRT